MKKRRLLVFGLVAVLLLTGAAYALWSDEVLVNVTATTGEAAIEISAAAFDGDSTSAYVDNTSIDIVNDDKQADVVIGNLYPGATTVFTVTIKNTGTIPVALDKIVYAAATVTDTKTNVQEPTNTLFDMVDVQCAIGTNTLTVSDESSASLNLEPTTAVQLNTTTATDTVLTVTVTLDSTATNAYENKAYAFSLRPIFEQDT